MVYLSQTAPGVEVQLLPPDSDQVLGSFTTSDSGVFIIPGGTALPAEFRLSAMTPEGLRVERYAEANQLDYLWLNIPSHLISLYKTTHPEISLAEAEKRVRAGLAIPLDGGLYGTSDGPASDFSHQQFQARALAEGGFEAFCRDLVRRIDAGQVTSFRIGSGAVGASTLARNAEIRGQLVVLASFGKFLLSETASAVFDSALEFGVGKIAAYTGSSFGKAAQYDAIVGNLVKIETDLEALTNEVTQGFLSQLINSDQNSLNQVLAQVKEAAELLGQQAEGAATLYLPTSSVYDHGPAAVPSTTTELLKAFSTVVGGTATSELTRVLTSSNLDSNLLNLAAEQESLVFGISNPGAPYVYYPLRRDDLTDNLNQNFNLYSGWTLLLAAVLSENGNASYLPQQYNTPGFDVPAVQLNEALQGVIGLAGMLHLAQQSVPESVGTELVVIDSENGLMWYLPTILGKYDVAQNGMIGLQVNNWTYPPGVAPPTPVGSSVSKDLVDFFRDPEMPGWRLPEQSELELLRTRVVAAGGGNNDNNTLAALKKLGFTGLQTSSDNFKKFWFNGSVVYTDTGPISFTYYDMDSGGTGGERTSIADPDADPLYTAVYVRTIRGLTNSTAFGDTGNQIDRSYDLGPDSLALVPIPVSGGPTGVDIFTFQLQGKHNNYSVVSDMGSRVQWSLTNLSSTNVAFLNYGAAASDPNTPDVPGNSQVQVIFRGPGSATLTATARNGTTVSTTVTGTQKPTLTSIMISPQNLAIQNNPSSGQFQQFYCTGYLSSGEAVDMTNLVTWAVVTDTTIDPLTAPIPAAQAQFESTGGNRGDLVFGGSSISASSLYARAIYNPAADPNLAERNFQTNTSFFNDSNGFTVFSQFSLPTP